MRACGLDLSLVSTLFMNILFSTDRQELKPQGSGKKRQISIQASQSGSFQTELQENRKKKQKKTMTVC